jgi:hypothetical protein
LNTTIIVLHLPVALTSLVSRLVVTDMVLVTGSRSPVKVVAGDDTDKVGEVTFPLPVAVTARDRSEVAELSASWESKLP